MNTTTPIYNALGLTPNELKVYQGFTTYPEVSAAKLSSLLHMDKSSTYRSVSNLLEYGLLYATPQGDTMTYKAADPEELKARFDAKVTELQNAESSINSLVSSLISTSQRKTHIRSETGVAAVEKAITESLNCNEKFIRELYRIHAYSNDKAHIQFVLNALRTRVANGVSIHQFFAKDRTKESPEISEIMRNSKELLKTVRNLPDGLDDMNSIRIWDDTTNIYSEDERGEILVITISDKYVTGFMKKMYDFIWNQSK